MLDINVMNEDGVNRTSDFLRDLQVAMSGGPQGRSILYPKKPTEPGAVYNGKFTSEAFNPPDDHYAVICNRPAQSAVCECAPITAQRNSGRWVVKLKEGTLPPKRMADGSLREVPSYVLVNLKMNRTEDELRDATKYTFKKLLAPAQVNEIVSTFKRYIHDRR